MRNVLTIAGKELRGFFASPIGWVVMGLFVVTMAGFLPRHLLHVFGGE